MNHTNINSQFANTKLIGLKINHEIDDAQLHVTAFWFVICLSIAIRLSIVYQSTWLVVLPVFVGITIITYLSMPVAAVFFLYGWVLFGEIIFPYIYIPTTSILTIWTVLWLLYWRYKDNSLSVHSFSKIYVDLLLLLAFFVIGIMVTVQSGHISNPLIRFYTWDIIRGWLGYFVVAVLSYRSIKDLYIMLISLPFISLIYPAYLPLQAWQDFFSYGLHASSVLSIGLSYGSLNTNTLGQASALASITAITGILTLPKSSLTYGLFSVFIVNTVVVLMTSSRQSILSLGVGILIVSLVVRSRFSIITLLIFIVGVYLATAIAMTTLSDSSGLRVRLIELTLPTSEWESGSFLYRQDDFVEAIEQWLENPLFGVGFGGQNINKIFAWQEKEGNFLLRGTHNLFLGILVQTGATGFIFFIIFLVRIIYKSLHIIRHHIKFKHNSKFVHAAIIGIISSICIQQNISGGLGIGSSSLIFILGALAGVISAFKTSISPQNIKSTNKL